MHALLRCRDDHKDVRYRMVDLLCNVAPRYRQQTRGQSDSVPQQRYCRSPKVSGLMCRAIGESAGVSGLFPVLGRFETIPMDSCIIIRPSSAPISEAH